MLVYRKKELQPEQKLESFISRESSFLFNNVFFLVICLTVLLGTTFPILSEWVTGSKVTVSAPFFNKVISPFAIGLILLTGICPLIAWRKASVQNLKRNFLYPLVLGVVAIGILLAFGVTHWVALLYFFACAFMLATVYFEFSRGTMARRSMVGESIGLALFRLIQRNKRRYGGFIIHAGVAVMFVGIAASSFYNLEQDSTVKPNESFHVRGYTITFRELIFDADAHMEVARAKLEVWRKDKPAGFVFPERHFYKNSEQPTTEVAIRPFWNEDLYMILAGWDEQGSAMFKVYVNPFIGLLWLGCLIMAIGSVVVLLPAHKPAEATSRAADAAGAKAKI